MFLSYYFKAQVELAAWVQKSSETFQEARVTGQELGGLPLQAESVNPMSKIKEWGLCQCTRAGIVPYIPAPPQQPHFPSLPDEPNSWAPRTKVYPQHNSGDLAGGVGGFYPGQLQGFVSQWAIKNKTCSGYAVRSGRCPLPLHAGRRVPWWVWRPTVGLEGPLLLRGSGDEGMLMEILEGVAFVPSHATDASSVS